MPPRRLTEPELPASARKAPGSLRKGWTTGTCAAAAAKAAALLLVEGRAPAEVEVPLPRGDARPRFAPERCERLGPDAAVAVVAKDAGDDPDVTHGAHLTVTVRLHGEPGLALAAGEGVGTVTRPGLGLEVGGPAINPMPRRQIAAALREVTGLDAHGIAVEISVPGGEKMARRTTNPRLGIVGGISILGTTGIVRPFSTAAWRASVGQAVSVVAAQGGSDIVLTTGGRTERTAERLLPHLEPVCFIEVGDFTGYAIREAIRHGLRRCVFVGMAGKLAKLAAGTMMTHWTRSKVDTALLAEITTAAGGDAGLAAAAGEANTARHAYELWRAAGLGAAFDVLCAQVAENLTAFAEGRLEIAVLMVDFEDLSLVGASPGARALVAA